MFPVNAPVFARVAAVAFLALLTVGDGARAQERPEAYLDEWAVVEGFALSIDAQGFELPTSIAFVPAPGPGPKDPLYFVTELLGKIKVVTNDRSIYTFAEGVVQFEEVPKSREGDHFPELGMGGICLEPQNGYVFVSFTYHTERGEIRNNVVRFQSTPGTFSLKPTGSISFTEIFEDQIGDVSHMIGPMIVHEGALFVHVGDAHAPQFTRSLSSTAGKILRMTLDGKPLPDNPHFADANVKNPANYVWARGLRNPFGVAIVNGKYFANDVGPSIDRFLRIERGGDYGYDGTDWSISSHAKVVFAPSVAPVQLVYYPPDRGPFPPELRDMFYLAASGDQMAVGPSRFGVKAILRIKYDFERDEVIDRPYEVVKYVGEGHMMPVGLALGPDGLYAVIFNSRPGKTHTYVMKIRYDPSRQHYRVFGKVEALMAGYGCLGCHRDDPGSPGPSLDPDELRLRLADRLSSSEYDRQSKTVDLLAKEPFQSYRDARRRVREASGDEKIRLWVKYRIMEPRFDTPTATMPTLGVPESSAQVLAADLVPKRATGFAQATRELLVQHVPKPRQRHLLVFFGAGIMLGTVLTAAAGLLLLRLRRKRARVG